MRCLHFVLNVMRWPEHEQALWASLLGRIAHPVGGVDAAESLRPAPQRFSLFLGVPAEHRWG
jgi:hypothetical protein